MKSIPKTVIRALALATGVVGAALLAGCGGGEQVESFHPARVIAFGDEFSVINADQSKYTVNAVLSGTANAFDCTANPIWVQYVGNAYGFLFPQCNPNALQTNSQIWAAYGATVADLSAQIDQQLNADGFTDKDIATVLVGVNDVVAQFRLYPSIGEDQLTANVTAAGLALARQVNRITGYGAKVLLATIPDVGLAPFAGDRSVGSTDSNPALLTRLSNKFNDALLSNIFNDGHKIGLIQFDEYLKAADTATRNGYNGATYSNTTLVACTVALPRCTTNTLVPEAANTNWLWADDRHFGARGQEALGSLALSRAQNNPF